ncbi:MAG: DUF2804 domain-containing protein [Verrucomicrobia bacterium]|nr:DUF2804 domain-containing protein [Verrucomicrobiota bacterium]
MALLGATTGILVGVLTAEGNGWSNWLKGRDQDIDSLAKYAIGGAATVDAAPEKPSFSLTPTTLSMTAIVRTNDTQLKVHGEAGDSLTGWSTTGVDRAVAANQTGVPEGCQRQVFSVNRSRSPDRLFLRLRAVLDAPEAESAPRAAWADVLSSGPGLRWTALASGPGKHAAASGSPLVRGPKGNRQTVLPITPPVLGVLPPAPPTVFSPKGQPLLGTYAGSFGTVDLRPRLWPTEYSRLKKWFFGTLSSKGLLAGFAVVDAGYGTTAFVYVVDLETGSTLVSRGEIGLPLVSTVVNGNPGAGARATFADGLGGSLSLSITRGTESTPFRVEIVSKDDDLRIDATLDPTAAPLPVSSLVPTPPGDINATVKWNLLPMTGSMKLGSLVWDLAEGFRGGFDYTQGILPSHTVWNWTFLNGTADDGTPIGLNLTGGIVPDGLTGDNALWAGNELSTLAKPTFTFNRQNYMDPWGVTTADGRVQLRFTPKGSHSENRNLGLVNSRFIQVAGLFNGTLRTAEGRVLNLVDVPGVMEDQDIYW